LFRILVLIQMLVSFLLIFQPAFGGNRFQTLFPINGFYFFYRYLN